jgi:hypothetical protein
MFTAWSMRHCIQRVFKWTACLGKGENGKIWKGRTLHTELFLQKCALFYTRYAYKEFVVWSSGVCQNHKKENVFWCWKGTINTEFICKTVLVKWMSVSVQYYKIMFSGRHYPDIFPFNKCNLLVRLGPS